MMALIISGCGGDDPSRPEPDPEPSTYTPADSAIIIPPEEQNTVLAYDPGTGDMELDESSAYAQRVVVGTIIVGQDDDCAPDGFLRKVTSVAVGGGRILLETGPALLIDAFEKMAITDTTRLRPSQIETRRPPDGTTLIPGSDDETFSVGFDCIVFDADANHTTAGDQIKLVGEYLFKVSLITEVDISSSTLDKLEVSVYTEEEIDLDLIAGAEHGFESEEEFDLLDIRLGAVPVGGVLWIVPALNVKAHLHGDMSVTFETAITCTQEIRNGFGYEKDAASQFYPISGSEKEFTFSPPAFTAEFDFEAGVSLNASCLLYGAAGPCTAGKTGFHFESVLESDPPCNVDLIFDLEAVFYAVAGLEMEGNILDLAWSGDYLLYTQPVGGWVFPLGGSGTVVVDSDPDSLEATWTLYGPCWYSHSDTCDQTLNYLFPGEYTVDWDSVSGYITPASDTRTLAEEGTIVFSGTYLLKEEKGTIIIDQTPDFLTGTGWTLTGPENETGSGDRTMTDMPTGQYTLTWDLVSGYITPFSYTKTLVAAGTIIFSGNYHEAPDPAGEFVLIPAGTFIMGSPVYEPDRSDDETQHTVTLTTPFYIFTTEVTNQQYAEMAQWAYGNGYCTATAASLQDALDGSTQELLDIDDSACEVSFSGGTFTVDSGMETHPVKEVTWFGAAAYCDWLSLRDGLPRAYDHSTWRCNGNAPYAAAGYRLPTEAEWEYACRAGTETPFNTGYCLDAGTEANYDGNYPYYNCPYGMCAGWTVPVGSYPENTFGLYDMHGNLWEWCNDWYGIYKDDVTDPVGPDPGTRRVRRGGLWNHYAYTCRSAARYDYDPGISASTLGFRPARSAD